MALRFKVCALALTSFLAFLSVANAKSCSNPSVRQEWNSMSKIERAEWISAVKCLAKLPHDPSLSPSVDPTLSAIPAVNSSSSYYDDIVYLHMDLNIKIHWTGRFLPWHRAYVHAFESALKTKCGYKGTQPYWNWSLHAQDFFNSPVFDPSSTSGLGTNGDPNNHWELFNGGFSEDFLLAYPTPHRLRRNFTAQAWQNFFIIFADGIQDPTLDLNKYGNTSFDKEEVNKLVTGFEGNFTGFQTYFERLQGAHAAVHLTVGGDLLGTCTYDAPSSCEAGAKWSSNDPMFFMHHAMVDKIWYDWQHKHEDNFWAYHGGSVEAVQNYTIFHEYQTGLSPYLHFDTKMPFDGLFEEYTIYDMMNTTGGTLCYVYT